MSEQLPSLGRLSSLLGYHLRRASGAFTFDFNDAMAGTGIRQVLLGVLAVVEATPGINQGAVGAVLDIKRANMVALINELVEAGLLTREVAAEDRRAFSLTLTPAGQVTLAECVSRIEQHEAKMLSQFTAEERKTLQRLLSRIAGRASMPHS